MDLSAISYRKFVDFALEELNHRGGGVGLAPISSHDKFRFMKANNSGATLHSLSFSAPKIRTVRSLIIEGGNSMQVLDFAVFPETDYDLPIFCANFFTTASVSVIVLDLNPLYDVTVQKDYKEKYYRKLLPLAQKYMEFFPWGGKITSESLRFFSPIVIWSMLSSSKYNHEILYSAFVDYFKAWLCLMDETSEERREEAQEVIRNQEAQHRYLTWRAEKDPGYPMLKKLFGEIVAKDLVRNFLFQGVDSLGAKTFLDYFPEYSCAEEDGKINRKRSVLGKSYETRPWDENGQFTGVRLPN